MYTRLVLKRWNWLAGGFASLTAVTLVFLGRSSEVKRPDYLSELKFTVSANGEAWTMLNDTEFLLEFCWATGPGGEQASLPTMARQRSVSIRSEDFRPALATNARSSMMITCSIGPGNSTRFTDVPVAR